MELKTTPLRGAGVLLGTLGGGVPSGSPNPHPISDKNVIFHTRFQTLPSGRNDLNLFGIFLLLSNSFRIGNDKYVHTLRSSLKNHTRFQTKMDQVYNRFQTKPAQKPDPMVRHIPI